jgi:uncharacterized protein YjiS (DUF1127 family)
MINDVPAYFEGALSFRLGDLGPQRRVKHLLLRLWNAYWDRQARRATAVMLHVLSDRTLADIGVDPSDVIPEAAQRRSGIHNHRRRKIVRTVVMGPGSRCARLG